MTVTPAVFVSSNCRNQSANINHIASQGKGSLLDGEGVSSIYAPADSVALNYGITGNQSDKLSSGCSANILAQSSAKVSADQSAKFYAGLKYETLSYPNPDIPNSGEITPFKGFIGVTTRGDIEFCQPINDRRVEFSESIKKGSVSTTQFIQSFDLMPRLSNSLRSNRLIQPALLSSPSSFMAIPSLSDKSESRRSCTTIRSFWCSLVDMGLILRIFNIVIANVHHCISLCKAKPRSGGTLTGLLTTNDNVNIEVAMSQYITPVTGRNSLPPNLSFRWLFLALERGNPAAKPHRIEATAPNEHSARLLLVRDYILSFAGRLPVREVPHE